MAATAPNNPKSYIAETGWPTESTTTADSNSGVGGADGEASVANLQSRLLRSDMQSDIRLMRSLPRYVRVSGKCKWD